MIDLDCTSSESLTNFSEYDHLRMCAPSSFRAKSFFSFLNFRSWYGCISQYKKIILENHDKYRLLITVVTLLYLCAYTCWAQLDIDHITICCNILGPFAFNARDKKMGFTLYNCYKYKYPPPRAKTEYCQNNYINEFRCLLISFGSFTQISKNPWWFKMKT